MNENHLSPAGAGETWVLTHTRADVTGPYTEADTFTDPRTAIHILAERLRPRWSRLAGKRGYPPAAPSNDFEAVALYFRNPREDLNGERFELDLCKTNVTHTPGAHVAGHAEYILVRPYQEWTCICGNNASASGFTPSDHRGVPDEDTWHGFHVCPDCGRVIHNNTGQVIGRCAVEPTPAQPTTKQEVTVSHLAEAIREQQGRNDARAHTAALAEHANRSAHWQPYGDGYDAPYVEVCGLDTSIFADDEGRLVVDLDTQGVRPLANWPDNPEIVVKVDGRDVWSSSRPSDEAAWRVRELVETTLERTASNAGGQATYRTYLADLVYDLASELPMTDPMRVAVEAERGSHAYTVTGMLDEHRELTVTAVIAGAHPAVDSEARKPGEYRFATVVYAPNPDEAERIARDEAAKSTDD